MTVTDSNEMVEKQLSSLREKVSQLEAEAEEMKVGILYFVQTMEGENALRRKKIKEKVDKLELSVAKKTSVMASLKPLSDFPEKRKYLEDLISSRLSTSLSLLSQKTHIRSQFHHLKAALGRITDGFREKNASICVKKYKEVADNIDSLSRKAQYLLEKVTEMNGEKRKLEIALESQPVIFEKSPKKGENAYFSVGSEVEPKWMSYTKSSFALILKAIDQMDVNEKLGARLQVSGMERALLIEKKLITALIIANQRAKIKAKLTGSRKFRSITKAAIINKAALPRSLAPVNLKQVHWEVNILKEKMYKSHFVRDVCLPGSALSPQLKISSSERLESLLTGAAGLKHKVKEHLKGMMSETAIKQPEPPLIDSSEEDFVASTQELLKKRNVALNLYTKNRQEIFKNIYTVATKMGKKHKRTVTSSGYRCGDLEGVTGVRGIERQLRTLHSKLNLLTLNQDKTTLKQAYCDMALARKRAKFAFTSKPATRLNSPQDKITYETKRSSQDTLSIENRQRKQL